MASLSSCPLCFFLLLLHLFATIVTAQSFSNISLGSSLSTQDKNPSWPSPSGDFAFGFHLLPDSNHFLLAIWFDKIPEKTIVWSANGDTPVQRGSKVELTNDGRLILSDPRGIEIWSYASSGSAIVSAAMLDTGNFVLASADSATVWESFGVSTDTILPSQILGLGSQLSSHLTETIYSKGRFQLRVQVDGNLVMYPVDLFTGSIYGTYSYWSTNTFGSGSQLIFNALSGYIYLTLRNGSVVNLSSDNGNMVSTKDFYHRATLDYDGGFRQYVYPKNHSIGSNGGSWSVLWHVPDNLCTALNAQVGSGICGYNSYCKLDKDQRPSCICIPGYSYLDLNNPASGCKQDFIPQGCGSNQSAAQFEIREMINTDWPSSEFDEYQLIKEDQCRQACLSDCFCTLAFFRDGTCWKKNLPLRNGRMDPSVTGKALVKLPRGNFSSKSLPPPSSGREKKDQGNMILVGSLLLGTSGFLNLIFLLVITISCMRSCNKNKRKVAASNPSMSGMNLRSFTYEELAQVTNGFAEELGSGSFGAVYKGALGSDTGNLVAVKKLHEVVKEGEKEFQTEVSAIGRIHHKNLVQLLGYCNEEAHRLLVYEFMSNGSLASFLFGSLIRPDWNQRMKIASGIARGLMYLHEECSTQIIHCDIKPQNILLDDCFTPRISDFGLAKLLKTDHSQTNTSIRGTRGYVAPDWFKNMPISVKVDVYSFGVMLMEIICCRRHVDPGLESEQKAILTDWVCDCYQEGRLYTLLLDDEAALKDGGMLERAVKVAIWCIQEDPLMRPSMKKVTQMLDGTVEVSEPPNSSSSRSLY